MKSITKLLALLVILSFSFDATAQSKKRKSKKDPILEKLWFGTGLDGIGLTNSSFGVGLSPTVGYKITDNFSAGLRVPFNYNYIKLLTNDGKGQNYSEVDLGVGAFTRYKIFRGLFAHAEYNQLFDRQPADGIFQLDPENPDKFLKETINRNEFNIGLGFSSGGEIQYEFGVLYNVIEPENSTKIPFTIRAGLNYNF